MNNNFLRIILLLTLLCIPAKSFAHAMFASEFTGSGAGIQATYDDRTAAAFSDVTVFAPDNGNTVFATGTTDSKGYYIFLPDRDGTWLIKVDDGMGHTVTLPLVIGGDLVTRPGTTATPRFPKGYGIIAGVGFIFGVFGWSAFIRLRMRCRSGKHS